MLHVTGTVGHTCRKTDEGGIGRKERYCNRRLKDKNNKIIKCADDQAVVSELEEELQDMINNILRIGKNLE